MRALDIDPVHDTRTTFRTLVDATSRPGTVEQTPTVPASHAVVATLVDHEVTLYGGDAELRTALERESRLDAAPFEKADVVVVDGHTDGRVTDANRGTLKEPSDGATIVYEVDALSEDTEEMDAGLTLAISGPGVLGTRTVAVDGLPASEIDAICDAQSPYPRGVDVYLTTDDAVVGLPRSVDIAVGEEVA
ncbi:phosphonate C-P lyase system protein PhnH [Haloferax volcanii]|uniref:phosphonate C-P lyase system protein PhnH n=1 Tax=Haloferax volcanii TaxID=2246 RepID=UPI00249C0913|nr:phosphonate C-P lyase system protein PhnH [Haloferax alexandrinus]